MHGCPVQLQLLNQQVSMMSSAAVFNFVGPNTNPMQFLFCNDTIFSTYSMSVSLNKKAQGTMQCAMQPHNHNKVIDKHDKHDKGHVQ
jgi:hypothetical protein